MDGRTGEAELAAGKRDGRAQEEERSAEGQRASVLRLYLGSAFEHGVREYERRNTSGGSVNSVNKRQSVGFGIR